MEVDEKTIYRTTRRSDYEDGIPHVAHGCARGANSYPPEITRVDFAIQIGLMPPVFAGT